MSHHSHSNSAQIQLQLTTNHINAKQEGFQTIQNTKSSTNDDGGSSQPLTTLNDFKVVKKIGN